MAEKISDERLKEMLASMKVMSEGTSSIPGAQDVWRGLAEALAELAEFREREAGQVYEYGVRYGDDHMVRRFSSRERAESRADPEFGDQLIRRVAARSVPAGEWMEVTDGD